ncbi:MAG: 50S ribosomal protein L16 [Candidatus Neomarinimicrobiota bacterium]|nr:MAG: 50S ribosomal protein L16 [Candidatus Neomarinimicrobiota bacterium]
MLEPTRVKFRRVHRGNRRGMAKGGTEVNFGSYGLKQWNLVGLLLDRLKLQELQFLGLLEKLERCGLEYFLTTNYQETIWETRMGKGKGAPEYWVSNVKPGRILFEVEGIPRDVAHKAFKNAGSKLPIKTKLVARRGLDESK